MRVLQINKFFFERGGSERYLFSISQSLEKRGHEVMHFSMRHPENAESPYSDYFVGEKDYSGDRAPLVNAAAGLSFIRSREAASNLSRLIEDTRPDVAHLHNIYHQITPSIIPVLGKAGIPVVMTLHDYKLVCPNYRFFNGTEYCDRCRGGRFYQAAATRCNNGSLGRSLLLSVEAYWQRITRVYDGVRFFLAPSRYMRDTFVAEGFGADRVVYLAPYVHGVEWNDDPPRDVPGGLPNEFFLYFGRLDGEKGLPTLFEALARTDGVPLVVCGDGPLREMLEGQVDSRLAGRVSFTGHLPKPLLDGVIRRSRAVVMPSEWPENAPFSVLEAMGWGVPVIVSNMGGLPELADLGGCLVFEAGNAGELSARITELWADEEHAQAIGRLGRDAVLTKLTEERHVTGLLGIYDRVLSEEHGPGERP
jgi:glycosyltransferase involved in cell wall biosynthesis